MYSPIFFETKEKTEIARKKHITLAVNEGNIAALERACVFKNGNDLNDFGTMIINAAINYHRTATTEESAKKENASRVIAYFYATFHDQLFSLQQQNMPFFITIIQFTKHNCELEKLITYANNSLSHHPLHHHQNFEKITSLVLNITNKNATNKSELDMAITIAKNNNDFLYQFFNLVLNYYHCIIRSTKTNKEFNIDSFSKHFKKTLLISLLRTNEAAGIDAVLKIIDCLTMHIPKFPELITEISQDLLTYAFTEAAKENKAVDNNLLQCATDFENVVKKHLHLIELTSASPAPQF